jgi:hypothetical protein
LRRPGVAVYGLHGVYVESQRRELDVLIDGLKAMAARRLQASEGYTPWALWLSTAGEVRGSAVGWGGEEELPTLVQHLTSRRSEMRAAAVVVELGDEAGISVMRFECEHSEGLAIAVVTPWMRSGSEIRLLNSSFLPGTPWIWA